MAEPSITLKHDEEHDQYHIGAKVDGTFIPFATVTGEAVRTEQAAEQNRKDAAKQA